MQGPFDDKVAFNYPCKPTEPCVDYDDYDPCDITDKDLAILLEEETAKLEQERAQAESTKQAPSNDAGDKQKEKEKAQEEKSQKEKLQPDFNEDEVVNNVPKKKNCKFIKNPFFTNRLKLSTSHLPLPPPGPPPQNFPLAIGNEPDPKPCRKLKKKCKRNDNNNDNNINNDNTSKIQNPRKDSLKREENEWGAGGKENKYEGAEGEFDGAENECEGAEQTSKPCVCSQEDLEERENCKCDKRKKKIVKKPLCKKEVYERPVCKKKESEVSVNFGPRNIPLQLKDLPETSPKDIPEVERQILMACGKSQDEVCKKKCKKKDKLK